VNLHGDRYDYPDVQIAALTELCRDIIGRHPAIVLRNVVGHSDIAPKRKVDPGLRFPWAKLAAKGIGLWPRAGAKPIEGDIQTALQRFGYPPAIEVTTADIVASFQRRFRPAKADGIADAETRALLADLLDQVGREA
jgi:N-acetylmuramoyl-L-alanine amidase